MYRDKKTGEEKEFGDLMATVTNTSFPKTFASDKEAVESFFDVEYIYDNPNKPTLKQYETHAPDGLEAIDGKWYRKVKVVDVYTEYKDSDGKTITKEDQIKALEDNLVTALAVDHRAKRDRLLVETDVYGLSDVTMSDNMKTYRQALRDLPAHSSWPNLADSDWPTKP